MNGTLRMRGRQFDRFPYVGQARELHAGGEPELTPPHEQFCGKQRLRFAVYQHQQVLDRSQFLLVRASPLGRRPDLMQQVDTGYGVRHLVAERQRPSQQPQHLRRAARASSSLGAPQRPLVGLRPVSRAVMVVGEVNGLLDIELPQREAFRSQRGRERRVQGPPLLRQQTLLQHLRQQGVDEPVPAIGNNVQDGAIHGRTQQPNHVAVDSGGTRDRPKLVSTLRVTRYRDQPGQLAGRQRQSVPGVGHGVPQLDRQPGR